MASAGLRPAADGVGAKMDVRMGGWVAGRSPKCIRFELFQNIQQPQPQSLLAALLAVAEAAKKFVQSFPLPLYV